MKILPIIYENSTSQLPESSTTIIKHLIRQANKETKPEKSLNGYKSTLINSLSSPLGDFFTLNSLKMRGAINDEGNILIRLHHPPTILKIKGQSGEIIELQKPFFTRIKTVLLKIEEFLNQLKTNFNNPKIVKKRFITKTLHSLDNLFRRTKK
jgi:hypothetical protein